jgi:hypothetical protein
MAHFAYIGGSLGAWATGTTVTAAKFWQFDQNQYKAINGDEGGAWSPTAKIVIGGANGLELSSSPLLLSGTASLSVAGSATFTGNFTATGSVNTIGNSSGDTLSVNAIASFAQLVVCANNLVSSGNTVLGDAGSDTCTVNANMTVVNDCTIGSGPTNNFYCNSTESHTGPETHEGTVAFTGNETHDGGETHTGAETHAGTAYFANTVTCDSTVTLNGNVNIGDSSSDIVDLKSVVHSSTLEGRVVAGTVYPTDANWTYGVFRQRIIYPVALLTADRDLNVSFSGDFIGDEVEIWNMSATYYVTVKNSGGATLGTVGAGVGKMAKLNWNGGSWVFLRV